METRKRFLMLGAVGGMILLLSGLAFPLITIRAEVDQAWTGQYYQNPDLAGTPDFTREDSVITFDWGDGPPAEVAELVEGWSGDYFSVRWTRTDYFYTETYIFAARSDDGVRVYVDGQLVIDEWKPRQFDWVSVEKQMTGGEHRIVVEYYEATGRAAVQAGYYPKNPIPAATNTPVATASATPASTGGGGGGGSRPTSTPRPTATPELIGTIGPLPTVGVPPSSAETGYVVEELLTKSFTTSGFPGIVRREGGYDGEHAYVKNSDDKITFEAWWFFEPDQAGFYDVFVYIPPTPDPATGAAEYRVFHNGVLSDPITIAQAAYRDEWVLLDAFYFVPGQRGYVTVHNATGESTATTDILLDAVMFVYLP